VTTEAPWEIQVLDPRQVDHSSNHQPSTQSPRFRVSATQHNRRLISARCSKRRQTFGKRASSDSIPVLSGSRSTTWSWRWLSPYRLDSSFVGYLMLSVARSTRFCHPDYYLRKVEAVSIAKWLSDHAAYPVGAATNVELRRSG
jgi:hypothetical protein